MIKNLKCEGLIEFHQHFVEQVSVTSNQHQDRLERNSCFTGSLNVCAKTCLDCFDHPERIVETCERSSVVGFHERNIGFAQDHVETREQVDTVRLYGGEVCLLENECSNVVAFKEFCFQHPVVTDWYERVAVEDVLLVNSSPI